jgi:glycosyltransferase involved in cell wall biosynthesis
MKILLIGTSIQTKGGIASVLKSYMGFPLFKEAQYKHIVTHLNGTQFEKLSCMLKALIKCIYFVAKDRDWVVHIHTASDFSFWRKSLFFLICWIFRQPIIIHIHGGGFIEFYQKSNKYSKSIIRWILNNACSIVVVSSSWVKKLSSIKIQKNIKVIHNPLPNSKLLEINNIKQNDSNNILYMGLIDREKGIFDYLQVINALKNEFPSITLHICGVGDLDNLKEIIQELEIEDNVVLHGWVGEEEIYSLFKIANIFILPSYYEGLPVSIVESLAASVPVITTYVGGIPDIIKNGENGFLVNPGDIDNLINKTRKLLNDSELQEVMGQNGRDTIIKEYTEVSIQKALNETYKVCLGKGGVVL